MSTVSQNMRKVDAQYGTAVNPHTGKRRIDEAFPPEARESTNEQGMFMRLNNGSTWSVIGSDRYDTALVGTSIAGVVFSEYALANPSAWAYTRPMLEENDGWAIFITTPRGRNHAFEMYKHASHLPGWFCELLTAKDTEALTREQLAEALAEYVALYGADQGTAQYKQEYLCDWQAAILGAFYALEMATVRDRGPHRADRGRGRSARAPGVGSRGARRHLRLVFPGQRPADLRARRALDLGRRAWNGGAMKSPAPTNATTGSTATTGCRTTPRSKSSALDERASKP